MNIITEQIDGHWIAHLKSEESGEHITIGSGDTREEAITDLKAKVEAVWEKAFNGACEMMEIAPELEIRSALKQAGSDYGISFGPPMGEFVQWSERRLGV